MTFSHFQKTFLLFLGVIFGFFMNQWYSNNQGFLNGSDTFVIQTNTGSDVFNTVKIRQAKKIIQKEYYHFYEKTNKEIEDGVLTSMVESLGDKHSSYFNQKEANEFSEMLRGNFEGIGAVIDEHIKGIIIRKVFDSSPAKKSGLQDGDIITKVGIDSMLGVKSEDAVKKIRGPKGSIVDISYIHGTGTEQKVQVTRDTIIIPSVQSSILSGTTIGYIQVGFFGEETSLEFEKQLQSITQSGVTSLILDFRDNGGGFLDTAVDILSSFFEEKTMVVRTRQNDPKLTEELRTKKSKTLQKESIPVVMLINGLSASATEIVAGALQDYKRAIILGEKSYGKGSVQEPFILEDGSILKITIGRWYTPNDQNIDKNGITPDIIVPLFEKDFLDRNDRQLKAAQEIITLLSASGATREGVIEKSMLQDYTK